MRRISVTMIMDNVKKERKRGMRMAAAASRNTRIPPMIMRTRDSVIRKWILLGMPLVSIFLLREYSLLRILADFLTTAANSF